MVPPGCPLDLAFVIDSSAGGLSSEARLARFQSTLEFVQQVISRLEVLDVGTWVAVEQFAANATIDIRLGDFTNERQLIERVGAIQMLADGSMRNVYASFVTLWTGVFPSNRERKEYPNAAIYLTGEGLYASDLLNYTETALGISILAVGVGLEARLSDMQMTASRDEFAFLLPTFEQTGTVAHLVVNALTSHLCGATTEGPPQSAGPEDHGGNKRQFRLVSSSGRRDH